MVLSDTPRRAAGVRSRTLDGEAVLVHPGQGQVVVVNGVGTRLWELADGQHTVSGMAQMLAGEYEVSLGKAEADALAFCHDLVGRGLLILHEPSS